MEALIYIPKYKTLITAVEGTGDNLLQEDIDDGCVDYAMSTIYNREGEDINIIDSGQIMFDKLVSEMSYDEFINRVIEYYYGDEKPYSITLEQHNCYEKKGE